jgi:hypothetical protein
MTMQRNTRILIPLTIVLLALTSASHAADWGSIKGKFVLKNNVPQKVVLIKKGDPAVKDPAVCAADTLYRNDLVIDPKTKGIQHIFIYLRRAPNDVHPDAAKVPEKEYVQNQKGCRFSPHTAFIRSDQKVKIISNDPVPHNTHGTFFKNQSFNLTIAPNDNKVGIEKTFPASESLPMPIVCDIHRHMKCHWLILDHPYAAITNEKGEFEIKNLPAGEHTFRVWHERGGLLERAWKVKVAPDKTTTLETYEVPLAKFDDK